MPTNIEIPKWTAEEFMRLVLEKKPAVAVLDCDGTLWSGDSGFGFMKWSFQQGFVPREAVEWLDGRYRAYVAGQVSEAEICGQMVQVYAGLREEQVRAEAARYVNEVVRQWVFPEMKELAAALRKSGTQLWAVSSTNRWVVSEGVREFAIPEERVLAAEVRVVNGRLERELVAVPTGEGKVAALVKAGLARHDAVFGNSLHDLAMLEIARDPYPVNPSPALVAAAAARGWGCFIPAGVDGSGAVGGEEPLPYTNVDQRL